MANTSGAVDLSANARTPEEEEALRSLQEGDSPQENERQKVLTSFLVVVDLNGNPQPIPLDMPQFENLLEPTPDLVYGAVATLLKDLTAIEASQATATVMQQQAQALQQQMQNAMIQKQISSNGGIRK